MLIIASCDKIDLDCETIETAESLPIPDGTRIEIEGSEYFKYTRVADALIVDIPSNGTAYYKGYPSITSTLSFQGELVDEN